MTGRILESKQPAYASKSYREWKRELDLAATADDKKREIMMATRTLPENKIDNTPTSYIQSRLLWSNAVSKIHQANAADSITCHAKLKARLTAMKFTRPEALIEASIKYLQKQTVIVVAFRASFLQSSGLTSFQLANCFERETGKSSSYLAGRVKTENALFSSTPEGKTLVNSNLARPRYGALALLDKDRIVKPTTPYGESFLILHHHVMFNALFAPSDTYNSYVHSKSTLYTLCSFHHFEQLLNQCSDNKLCAIIHKATGTAVTTSKSYDQQKSDFEGYVEALLPAINFLDPNIVKHIHIHKKSYTVTQDELKYLAQMGLSVSNTNADSYLAPEEKVPPPSAQPPVLPSKAIATPLPEVKNFSSESEIKLLNSSFLRAISDFDSKDSDVLASINKIKELFTRLQDGTELNAPTIILGCIIIEKQQAVVNEKVATENYSMRLQGILKAFDISETTYEFYQAAYFSYRTSLSKKEIPITLIQVKDSFAHELKDYKTKDPRRLESIKRVKDLFTTLEEKKNEMAELVILGCIISEANLANSQHKPRLFKQTSKLANLLNRIIKHLSMNDEMTKSLCLDLYQDFRTGYSSPIPTSTR